MKISKNELRKISTRICDLACECQFVADEAKVYSRIVGVYSDSSDSVIDHLQQVLRRADNLLDALHCVSASLDDLLVKSKYLDDVEVADV